MAKENQEKTYKRRIYAEATDKASIEEELKKKYKQYEDIGIKLEEPIESLYEIEFTIDKKTDGDISGRGSSYDDALAAAKKQFGRDILNEYHQKVVAILTYQLTKEENEKAVTKSVPPSAGPKSLESMTKEFIF